MPNALLGRHGKLPTGRPPKVFPVDRQDFVLQHHDLHGRRSVRGPCYDMKQLCTNNLVGIPEPEVVLDDLLCVSYID